MSGQPVLINDVTIEVGQASSPHNVSMTAKQLGAYYTDSQVADHLTRWAIRTSRDTVLDPSFGGGVFLRAASKRLRELGGDPSCQVLGIEIDRDVHCQIGKKLNQEFGIQASSLIRSDFFGLDTASIQVDAVVGNPPFIRFHRFAGPGRDIALSRSSEAGVSISKLTSSWAPFLVHACTMLRTGGRLAMVVPAELGYASYAAPVLRYLRRSFGSVSILAFREKLFRDLNEDTFLITAEGYGCEFDSCRLLDYGNAGSLNLVEGRNADYRADVDLDLNEVAAGRKRLIEAFIEPKVRDLYNSLRQVRGVNRLGRLARVGIGYVTGGNAFFHLTPSTVASLAISDEFTRRSVMRGRALKGLSFTDDDWRNGTESGDAGYLLSTDQPVETMPPSLRAYMERGKASGVADGFKCRNRKPWYGVPHVYVPDAFLTYMSGRRPRLAANAAGAVAPNTLHVVRLLPGHRAALSATLVGWSSSLTRLSMEIEGHALGGGMLKIEPTEAEKLLVPLTSTDLAQEIANEIDHLIRGGRDDQARELADGQVLVEDIGLSRAECESMMKAADQLADRRMSRGAAA